MLGRGERPWTAPDLVQVGTAAPRLPVADGACWLPNTRFAGSVRGRHRTPIAVVLPAAKRRLRVLQGR